LKLPSAANFVFKIIFLERGTNMKEQEDQEVKKRLIKFLKGALGGKIVDIEIYRPRKLSDVEEKRGRLYKGRLCTWFTMTILIEERLSNLLEETDITWTWIKVHRTKKYRQNFIWFYNVTEESCEIVEEILKTVANPQRDSLTPTIKVSHKGKEHIFQEI